MIVRSELGVLKLNPDGVNTVIVVVPTAAGSNATFTNETFALKTAGLFTIVPTPEFELVTETLMFDNPPRIGCD